MGFEAFRLFAFWLRRNSSNGCFFSLNHVSLFFSRGAVQTKKFALAYDSL